MCASQKKILQFIPLLLFELKDYMFLNKMPPSFLLLNGYLDSVHIDTFFFSAGINKPSVIHVPVCAYILRALPQLYMFFTVHNRMG